LREDSYTTYLHQRATLLAEILLEENPANRINDINFKLLPEKAGVALFNNTRFCSVLERFLLLANRDSIRTEAN